MSITPEQLREIALKHAGDYTFRVHENELVEYVTLLFTEFQKLQAEQEPVDSNLPTF